MWQRTRHIYSIFISTLTQILCGTIAIFTSVATPYIANAHEVYVLSDETVGAALSEPSFSLWEVMLSSIGTFLLWAFIGIFVVFVVFFVSISRNVEQAIDPFLAKLPPYAPVVARIAIALSFLAAAHYQAIFGPELPLQATYGSLTPLVTTLLYIIGLMLLFGFYARIAAVLGLCLFAIEVIDQGAYMLTYANYAGELILITILGAHQIAFHHRRHDEVRAPKWFLKLKARLTPYTFLILRIAFGVSLLYASIYAKILHDNLALAVTLEYPELLTFFGFEAHFLVLGAAIIEIVIALFFILGIEIRFTALFILFWLSLSLWYFGEAVWPHLILIGIPIAFFCYGYDKYSLEGYFFKRDGREPVL